jgi:hypothetical protein
MTVHAPHRCCCFTTNGHAMLENHASCVQCTWNEELSLLLPLPRSLLGKEAEAEPSPPSTGPLTPPSPLAPTSE